MEIAQSTKVIEIELSDMQGIDYSTIVDYFKQKIEVKRHIVVHEVQVYATS